MNTARGMPDPGVIRTACAPVPTWVAPEQSPSVTVLARRRALAGPVPAGWNITGPLHVLLREDERGH
jgi:hypothetical protein